ncbi:MULTISPECIES: family 1 glycosylhydrolase [Ramlibacter]|uniref:Family 1 glycosylhydrolase n=1 Tax=Ramlibacter pinisoli TaxID=2682844 RepID=A0A6N8IPK4_9BURK|nr:MULTISPECIES: family 1 glycosylhydrolase [Ramlibacter]MBA2963802.1 family 1 glycosylhydrolase [Ramlibacter sp. CGMCC 1.13660]MVQ28768.1 family 1 glycosylhydrolase [Ramlibacter pinisoli]
MLTFMFATGIENSDPTIDNGRRRIDELEKCGFYQHWRTDFELVQDMGIRFLRYGPSIHNTWLGDGRYDWAFSDETLADLKRRDIVPIVDLCHFGVPDWVGNFQNPDFPGLFEGYARDFAARYPWVQLYTPVNEMFICATFSGRWGWWNEQMNTDRGFVTALKHLVKANILAMHAILDVRADALFIQSESSEHFHPQSAAAIPHADAFNEQRFLSLDLNYGVDVSAGMLEYLMDGGMTAEEYRFFRVRNLRPYCIMGNDYYRTNEHLVWPDGRTEAAGEIFGYHTITQQYHERYRLPVMHTETNLIQGPVGDEAVSWLHKEWANVLRIRRSGVPVLGFTWYSLTDQVDWDVALREDRGTVNPLGLFDLDRNIRPVGRAYKELIAGWSKWLHAQSICLTIPVFSPSQQDDPLVIQERAEAHANWLSGGRAARPELAPREPLGSRKAPVAPSAQGAKLH